MSTGSKRRAPENCFPMCIWYVFLILRCRGESDPRLYTTSVLSKGMPHCQIVTNCAVKYIFGSEVSPCSGILFANTEFVNRPRSQNMFPQFSFTFWYQEHIANSYKKKCERSAAFASSRHARGKFLFSFWTTFCETSRGVGPRKLTLLPAFEQFFQNLIKFCMFDYIGAIFTNWFGQNQLSVPSGWGHSNYFLRTLFVLGSNWLRVLVQTSQKNELGVLI